MKRSNMAKLAGGLAAISLLAAPQAMASFDLTLGNSVISGFPGPYATVSVDLISSTQAKITFTSLENSGKIYLLGDGSSVAVNVNATSWTLANITGSNAGTGFTPGTWWDGGAGNVSEFGVFNQTINSFDGFSHSSDIISFVLTDTGGTWATAADVLTKNADGNSAAAHIFVTADPAKKNNGAIATGFAADGPPVPEPTTLLAGGGALLLALLGVGRGRLARVVHLRS
jgi:hypothetical protein